MSKQFWIAVTMIVTAFAVYETAINLLMRRENDRLLALSLNECLKPAADARGNDYVASR